jgi:hypothetical protein
MSSAELVGRADELARVRALLDARGGALVLTGEAGIGKSMVLEEVRAQARARGFALLSTAGVENETGLPYAGLHRLVRPLAAEIDGLGALHRGALRAALGLGDAAPAEPLVVARALLELLTAHAANAPVLVVADDLHWLDEPSRSALAYAGRHLGAAPVVLVGALRDGYADVAAGLDLPVAALRGLAPEAAEQVLAARGPALAAPVRDRLLAEAAGNPLALIELPAMVTAQAAGREQALLPLSARLERAFAARLGELPGPTRRLLLVAAADGESTVPEVLAAGARLDGGAPGGASGGDALAPAVRTGLIALRDDALEYRHPLVRSAIYQAATLTDRLAAHDALAATLGDADRRIWHLAAATVRRDDDVADAVEAVASRARARGAVLEAAVTLGRAAQLTADAGLRAERLLASAELAFEAGRADLVRAAVEEAQQLALDDRDRARAELLSEIFYDGVAGDVARVYMLVDDAREVARLGDVELALKLLHGAAVRCWWAALDAEVRGLVLETAEALPVTLEDPRLLAIVACVAPLERGADVVARVPAAVAAAAGDPLGTWYAAMAAHAVGDHALAREILSELAPALRAAGRYGLLTQVLSMLQWDAAMLGDWETCEATATEGAQLAQDTGQPVWGAGLTCGLAAAAAVAGEPARAEHLATQAEAVIVPHGLADMHSVLLTVRGITALRAGHPEDALAILDRLFDPSDPAWHYRERLGGLPFYIEAALGCNHPDRARELLSALTHELTSGTPAPAVTAALAAAAARL